MFDMRDLTERIISDPKAVRFEAHDRVADILQGRSLHGLNTVLPGLFSDDAVAQTIATKLALGLPLPAGAETALRQEVVRMHSSRFLDMWSAKLGLELHAAPDDNTNENDLRDLLFGAEGELPRSPDEFEAFLATPCAVARVMRTIDTLFDADVATSDPLPNVSSANAFNLQALENSTAGRHDLHPVMRHITETRGRGPLWRAAGRALDLIAAFDDRLPKPSAPRKGEALVAGSRGLYAVTAEVTGGVLNRFARMTPTVHMILPGGSLDSALLNIPPDKAGLASLLVDIFDPGDPAYDAGHRR